MQQFLFISFFQCEISEVPRPIAAKFCHMVESMFSFIMPIQKFGGKKHVKFGAILDPFLLWAWIWNGYRYPKSENWVINSIFSRVQRKKVGPLTMEI